MERQKPTTSSFHQRKPYDMLWIRWWISPSVHRVEVRIFTVKKARSREHITGNRMWSHPFPSMRVRIVEKRSMTARLWEPSNDPHQYFSSESRPDAQELQRNWGYQQKRRYDRPSLFHNYVNRIHANDSLLYMQKMPNDLLAPDRAHGRSQVTAWLDLNNIWINWNTSLIIWQRQFMKRLQLYLETSVWSEFLWIRLFKMSSFFTHVARKFCMLTTHFTSRCAWTAIRTSGRRNWLLFLQVW